MASRCGHTLRRYSCSYEDYVAVLIHHRTIITGATTGTARTFPFSRSTTRLSQQGPFHPQTRAHR
jgi:hypothetical protein